MILNKKKIIAFIIALFSQSSFCGVEENVSFIFLVHHNLSDVIKIEKNESEKFQHCIDTFKTENPLNAYLLGLKSNNYYIVPVFKKDFIFNNNNKKKDPHFFNNKFWLFLRDYDCSTLHDYIGYCKTYFLLKNKCLRTKTRELVTMCHNLFEKHKEEENSDDKYWFYF